jgi:hypothetical protein
MNESIVSAEAAAQQEALARLTTSAEYIHLRALYPKVAEKFEGDIQFQINRTERTARLAYIEQQVKEILSGVTA